MTEVTRNSKQQQYGTMGNNPQPQPQEEAVRFEDVEWRQDDSSDPTKYAFWISSGVWVVSMVLRLKVFNATSQTQKSTFTYAFGIPAYIICVIATCSFISAFVCFLLTWRSRSQKWPRIVAAAVLYAIAVLCMFSELLEDTLGDDDVGTTWSLVPLTFLVLASCGLMSAFVWAYQKLAWLRGIIGVALTVAFVLAMFYNDNLEKGSFPRLLGICLIFPGFFSSIAFTLVSFLFSTFCCCSSWKDDGDDSNTSIAARDGSPTGDQQDSPTVTNSNAGNGSPNSQGSPTVTNSNAGNGSPNSQGSPTVGNSNAGDGAQGDGSQGTQQGGANSNAQAVNYSGTDNNV